MTIDEAIEQLEDLKRYREGFAKTDEPDGVFAHDAESIDIAVKALKENKELKRLLKLAVEDLALCIRYKTSNLEERGRKWVHADEAMKLIGEDNE